MGRPRKTSDTETAWERRLQSDRDRSQRYRDRAEQLGRPSGAKVDRAIMHALREAWRASIDRVAGGDPQARAAAMRVGVDLVEVGGRAVEWLCRCERADRDQARQMVLARMRPPAPKRRGATRDAIRDALRGSNGGVGVTTSRFRAAETLVSHRVRV